MYGVFLQNFEFRSAATHLRCLSLPVLTHVERDRGWGSAYVTHNTAHFANGTSFALLLWGWEDIYVRHTSRPDSTVAGSSSAGMSHSAALLVYSPLFGMWGGGEDVDRGILNGD